MRELVFIDGKPVVQEVATLCTPRQIRIALYMAGLLDTVNAIAKSDPIAEIAWEFATSIDRHSPLISSLQNNSVRPFTDDEIDQLFAVAVTL